MKKIKNEILSEQRNREMNHEITRHYPGGTVVEKVEFAFSLSKGTKGNISTAKVHWQSHREARRNYCFRLLLDCEINDAQRTKILQRSPSWL